MQGVVSAAFKAVRAFRRCHAGIIYLITFTLLTGLSSAQALIVTPATVDFGSKVTTETGANKITVNARAPGGTTLNFTGAGVTITGPDAADFTFQSTPTTTTLGSGFRAFEIGFSPTSPGSKQAELVFTTTSPETPTTTISLSGLGLPYRSSTVQGQYDGYGPGISTIGTGGHYASLFEATQDVRRYPLTGGNWTFLFLNDLQEPNNSFIAQRNTNGHTLEFRPAPNTNPTITFTTSTSTISNHRIGGHITIGLVVQLHLSGSIQPVLHSTHNILFDGSNIPGESHQNLTFSNVDGPGASAIFHVRGDSDYVQIRNCRIHSHSAVSTAPGNQRGHLINFDGDDVRGDLAAVPDYGTIYNCDLNTTATGNAAIAYNWEAEDPRVAPEILVPASRGVSISRNTIRSGKGGISVGYAFDSIISSNTVDIQPPPVPLFDPPTGSIGIYCVSPYVSGSTDHFMSEITANTIRFHQGSDPTSATLLGIGVHSNAYGGSSFLISNNSITGLDVPPLGYAYMTRYGIHSVGFRNLNTTILHNSIHMNSDLTTASHTPNAVAGINVSVDNFTSSSTAVIRNNIVHTSIPNSTAINSPTDVPAFIDSDYNNLYVTNGAITAHIKNVRYTTLDDWQTSRSMDLNSISHNPFVPAGPGLGVWVGPEHAATPDLHFTSHPGPIYHAPPYPGIITDIDGDPRPALHTTMGADEAQPSAASVSLWGLY